MRSGNPMRVCKDLLGVTKANPSAKATARSDSYGARDSGLRYLREQRLTKSDDVDGSNPGTRRNVPALCLRNGSF
jgi:hypothetical protein